LVASAARLCYSDIPAGELHASLEEDRIPRLLSHLRKGGHLSTFEHASFTFSVDGISRVCSHQLVRHRLASYSQRSQRYVPAGEDRVVLPPSVAADPEAKALFEEAVGAARRVYAELLNRGIPKEDARFVLPHGAATSLFVTMNARELLHFFSLRLCRRAQWEIRDLARRMLLCVREAGGPLFDPAGPSCLVCGVCREGSSCGHPYGSMEELLSE
jgi:thymidylate synthase (FAD)